MNVRKYIGFLCLLSFLVLVLPGSASADWLKPPQTDVDKVMPDLTCWLATAANMLAAAGYGSTGNPHTNAVEIYNELKTRYNPYQ
jgi:hypothetical protein